MKKLFLAFLAALSMAAAAAAQSCPTGTVTGPTANVNAGDQAVFTVNIKGGDPTATPTYSWRVSAGMIEGGQGTSVIRVATKGAGQSITATVQVLGFSADCYLNVSATAFIIEPPTTRKLDEFNYLGAAKLEAVRLDEVAITLQNEPDANGYIIFYLGRKGVPGAVKAWANQTVGHLVKRGIDKTRIVRIDGGYRENGSMEIYIVPTGAEPPAPSPTIDPSEITPAKKPAVKKPTSKKRT